MRNQKYKADYESDSTLYACSFELLFYQKYFRIT